LKKRGGREEDDDDEEEEEKKIIVNFSRQGCSRLGISSSDGVPLLAHKVGISSSVINTETPY
jgi:hypothetical protein